MTLKHEFNRTPSYVIIRSSGVVESMEELQAYMTTVADYCARENCRRVMSDERGIDYKFTALEHFEIAEWLEQEAFDQKIERAATLTTESQFMNLKDLEIFAVNRGLNVKIFSSEQEAAKWLERT